MKFVLRPLALLLGVIALSFAPQSRGAEPPALPVDNGEVNFVISNMAFGLGRDEDQPMACPDGMSKGFIDAFKAAGGNTDLKPNEDDQSYNIRIYSKVSVAPNGDGLCVNPKAAPDPYFRTVAPVDIPADGIDLDGQASRAEGSAVTGTCAHDDFRGTDGQRDVDNQMYRVLGCVHGYQEVGASRTLDAGMLAREWTILVTLKDVDNRSNDDDVKVGIYSTLDPLQIDARHIPLADATYTADTDPRFRATTQGRIVDGVLTTDPVDVRFRWSAEGWRLVRPLRHARLHLSLSQSGAEGYVSGYTPIDEWFANNYSYSAAVTVDGKPASDGHVWYSSIGTANSQGFTCNGLYQAMQRYADGDRDANSGRCTSLSTQYHIRAIPAFVITQ